MMEIATHAANGRLLFAVRLMFVRRPESTKPDERRRDVVAVLTALEGHKNATFTVQWASDPRIGDPHGGRTEVSVIVSLPDDHSAALVEEVADDLLDLLNGPPHLWRFAPVASEDELAALLHPMTPRHLAEIARREEELPSEPARGALGFHGVPAPPEVPALWTLWILGPPAPDTDRLAASLLAQEAPVALRMTLSPSELTPVERDHLEWLVHEEAPGAAASALYRAAFRTLESMLYLRPVFRAQCLIASPDPLSASLLSTVGHTLSEPQSHIAEPPPALSGGYAMHRDQERLARAFDSFGVDADLPSIAPEPLRRLRGLFGVWEAGNLFRLPILDEDADQGLTVDQRPSLPGVLRELPSEGTRLGTAHDHPGRYVAISPIDRARHAYVVGQTGTGKSTLMLNMALDDIGAGHGVCVIDPHGDLVEGILARLPRERIRDVVLIDPGDTEAVVGVNLIEAESDIQQNYLVSELSNMMYSLFDPQRQGIVGPRFETMLRQAVLLLQSDDRIKASILDVPTLFSDLAVRNYLVKAITDDPMLLEYWKGEVAQNRSNDWGEVLSWFRSKFEVFRTSKLMRGVVGQAESTVSFSEVLREGKILLVNLSKGTLGEYNSAMLGHVIMMKLWGSILERSRVPVATRRPFFVFIDEFQNFTTDSLDSMLAEARKFGVGLTLANQFFEQLPPRTQAALLGNVGSKLAFRLGASDATAFSGWLGGDVDREELTNLSNHELVASLSPNGMPTAPVLLHTLEPTGEDAATARVARNASRAKYGTPIEVADQRFLRRWASVSGSYAATIYGGPESPAQPEGPSGGGHRSFLDEWMAARRETAGVNRTWLDEWIAQRLATRSDESPTAVRLTPLPWVAESVVEDLANAADLDKDPVAPSEDAMDPLQESAQSSPETWRLKAALAGEQDGILVLPGARAMRLVLEARVHGIGAEVLSLDLASPFVPDAVRLDALGLPDSLVRRLRARGAVTAHDVRILPEQALQDMGLPEEVVAAAHALRRLADGDPVSPAAAPRLSLDISELLAPEEALDLRRACAEEVERAVAMLLTSEQSVESDAGCDPSGNTGGTGGSDWLGHQLRALEHRRVQLEVSKRAEEIIELLGVC